MTLLSRRALVAGMALAPLLSACGRGDPSKQIGFASTGGPYNDLLRRVWTDDFAKRTGVAVNLSSNTSLAQARLQAQSEAPEWDVLELTAPWYQTAVKEDFLLPLDTDIVKLGSIDKAYVGSHGVQYAMFTNCMAWNPEHAGTDRAPAGWADMWDRATFKGRRSLDAIYAGPGTMEIALMADGVAPDKLYPLDLDRAFRSLDRLGRDNVIWATTLQEPIQRLVSGEVSMGPSWPYRIMLANKGGAKLKMNFNQCAVAGDYVGVVKTSRNPKAAFQLINDLINNVPAIAEFSRATHYGSPNLASLKLMPKEDADQIPTNPVLAAKLFTPDADYWSKNLEMVSTRFKQWQLA